MRFHGAALVASLLAPASLALAQAGAVNAVNNEPLVGSWTWTVPINGCTERYVYRADGSSQTTSRDELTRGTYQLSAQPLASGRYRLERVTTEDNRGRDCADVSTDETGRAHVVFVEFDSTRRRHWVCAGERSERCLGPLTKE